VPTYLPVFDEWTLISMLISDSPLVLLREGLTQREALSSRNRLGSGCESFEDFLWGDVFWEFNLTKSGLCLLSEILLCIG